MGWEWMRYMFVVCVQAGSCVLCGRILQMYANPNRENSIGINQFHSRQKQNPGHSSRNGGRILLDTDNS